MEQPGPEQDPTAEPYVLYDLTNRGDWLPDVDIETLITKRWSQLDETIRNDPLGAARHVVDFALHIAHVRSDPDFIAKLEDPTGPHPGSPLAAAILRQQEEIIDEWVSDGMQFLAGAKDDFVAIVEMYQRTAAYDTASALRVLTTLACRWQHDPEIIGQAEHIIRAMLLIATEPDPGVEDTPPL